MLSAMMPKGEKSPSSVTHLLKDIMAMKGLSMNSPQESPKY